MSDSTWPLCKEFNLMEIEKSFPFTPCWETYLRLAQGSVCEKLGVGMQEYIVTRGGAVYQFWKNWHPKSWYWPKFWMQATRKKWFQSSGILNRFVRFEILPPVQFFQEYPLWYNICIIVERGHSINLEASVCGGDWYLEISKICTCQK